jgi:hypothetical protein
MAEPPSQLPAWTSLVLEYLKVLISIPALLLLFLVMFGSDVHVLLRDNREMEIAGLFKLGAKTDTLVMNTREELSDMRQRMEEIKKLLDSAPPALQEKGQELLKKTTDKISAIEANIVREKEAIDRTIQQAQSASPDGSTGRKIPAVAVYEQQGFEAILRRDIDAAIKAFQQARNEQADYHNVEEIGRLLQQEQGRIQSDAAHWKKVVDIILTKYSWGMPEDIRRQMRASVW